MNKRTQKIYMANFETTVAMAALASEKTMSG